MPVWAFSEVHRVTILRSETDVILRSLGTLSWLEKRTSWELDLMVSKLDKSLGMELVQNIVSREESLQYKSLVSCRFSNQTNTSTDRVYSIHGSPNGHTATRGNQAVGPVASLGNATQNLEKLGSEIRNSMAGG